MIHSVDNGSIHERNFGGMWNQDTHNLHIAWYDDDPEHRLIIERPFSSKRMTLSRAEATALRDSLNEYLAG